MYALVLICNFLFADFSFEYLSIIAGTVVFAVVSVRAQRNKEVKYCRLYII